MTTMDSTITLKKIHHRNKDRIGLFFDYDQGLVQKVKQLPDRAYSKTLNCWYLPYTKSAFQSLNSVGINYIIEQTPSSDQIGLTISSNLNADRKLTSEPLKGVSKPEKRVKKVPRKTISSKKTRISGRISSEWRDRLSKFKVYLEQNRYSASTVSAYMQVLRVYFIWYGERSVSDMDIEVLRKFSHSYFFEGKYSRSYQNIWINAIKLFLEKFGDIPIDVKDLERPRKSGYLPNVLSEHEIRQLIASYRNLKHKAIIMTIYACGLRKSELLNLKLDHLDGQRKVLRVVNSKGAKDRDIALPEALLKLLRQYFVIYKPKVYLFNGQHRLQYSASSVDKILKNGLSAIKITKKITPHCLRHSYATHLVEKNINLRYIQESLGHKSSKTTELYTRLSKENISNMVSPVDFWEDINPTLPPQKGVDNTPKNNINNTFGDKR